MTVSAVSDSAASWITNLGGAVIVVAFVAAVGWSLVRKGRRR